LELLHHDFEQLEFSFGIDRIESAPRIGKTRQCLPLGLISGLRVEFLERGVDYLVENAVSKNSFLGCRFRNRGPILIACNFLSGNVGVDLSKRGVV